MKSITGYLAFLLLPAGIIPQLRAQSTQYIQVAQSSLPTRSARPTQQAQSIQPAIRTVSGSVTSEETGSPLEGVTVWVKGGSLPSGTLTDGAYYVPVSETDSLLEFRLDGFEPREVRLTASGEYNVVLRRSPNRPPFSAVGNWRAVFRLRSGVEVPVNFDIRAAGGGPLQAYFHNAEERFDGGWVRQTGDSLFVFLDQFDNELAFHITDSGLVGVLKRQDGTGVPLPVTAQAGIDYRFKDAGIKPAGDISGTYDISFHSENGKDEKAVGVFRQQGNILRATFLRVTGDSRYLEGIVQGDQFYLSSFIGSGPAYYSGSFTADGKLSGAAGGGHAGSGFTGVHNEKAALPDAYSLTYLKPGYTSFDFSLPDVNGQIVSLKDKKYRGKVVILTIGGTWCPNCIDETSFLAPWYAANRSRGVEVISIQYERQTDTAFVRKVLSRQREKYAIAYDQVFGGLADKQVVAQSLPSLNTFLAFPTTIFIDKNGKVDKIHTGYSGPATGIYYQQFLDEFNSEVNSLVSH